MSATVELCGKLCVKIDGIDVAARLPARQGRLLFAYLVLSRGRVARRDELVDAIWPERAPINPEAALASVLARLRRVVGSERLPARESVRLELGDEARIDVEIARAAPAAVRAAVEHGRPQRAYELATEALAILERPLLPEFERPWLDEQRRALADLLAPLTEGAVDAALLVGGPALQDVEWLARRGVERDPLRESAYAALMRLLAARGDVAEALRVFDALRIQLREQLGVSPSTTLRALHQQLLTDAPQPPTAPSHASPTVDARATVPVAPAPMIGRDHDLTALEDLLGSAHGRLVTIVGPGGVGKTRLAIEAARTMAASATVWVPLAPLRAADEVALAVARAVAVSAHGGDTIDAALQRFVAQRELLLVLDNFEHVLDAAQLVADLLAAGERLTVLATSREPLGIRAERLFALAPLALPAAGERAEPGASPATDLFLATATRRGQALTFTDEEAAAAAEICRRVDGLPLGIELAAGRLGLLSPPEVHAQLLAGLDALAEGPRDAPDRQRTMRHAIAWSYRLLSESERAALASFAVFAGGASPEAAMTVTGAGINVLQALVSKHLLTLTIDEDRERRLDMLETIRHYAREQLSASGDLERTEIRHAEAYLAFAESVADELRAPGETHVFRRVRREVHNLRGAMGRSLEHGAPERCVRIAVALKEYWPCDTLGESARWLAAGIDAAGPVLPAPLLARALAALADGLSGWATMAEAEAAARRAVDAAREAGDPALLAETLIGLTYVLLLRYRERDAHGFAEEAAALAATADNPTLLAEARLVQASSAPDIQRAEQVGALAAQHFETVGNLHRLLDLYNNLTYLALAHGDNRAALAFQQRARAAAQQSPLDHEIHGTLANETLVRLLTGDLAGARRALADQLALAPRLGVDRVVPEALLDLAALSASDHDDELAARLSGLAEARGHVAMHPAVRQRLEERFLAPARVRLGQTRWDVEVAAGRDLDLTDAITLLDDPARATVTAARG